MLAPTGIVANSLLPRADGATADQRVLRDVWGDDRLTEHAGSRRLRGGRVTTEADRRHLTARRQRGARVRG